MTESPRCLSYSLFLEMRISILQNSKLLSSHSLKFCLTDVYFFLFFLLCFAYSFVSLHVILIFSSRSSTMHFLGLSSFILSLLLSAFASTLVRSLLYVDFCQFHTLRLLFPSSILEFLVTYWILRTVYSIGF